MPRTAKAKKARPTLTTADKAPAKNSSNGRAADGKFTAGNAGGPGNPHARHCARMLALLRTCVTDEDMVAIIRTLVEMAKEKDTSAAKILLSYKIGKPTEAPNPDLIDRDEWEHYQHDTINLQQMQQVLGSLPTRVGNDIARTALPIITEARTRHLAAQLSKGCPVPEEVVESTDDPNEASTNASPLSNGKSNESNRASHHDNRRSTDDSRSTPHAPRTTPKGSSTTNDNRRSTNDSRSTLHAPRPMPKPLSNGKSKKQSKVSTKRKKARALWLQSVAKRVKT